MKIRNVPPDIDAVRRANMARIRGENTRPELQLRQALWRRGLRYRIGLRVERARPDMVFPARKIAVFVDGCFWHGCTEHYVRPRSRPQFWAAKLASNTTRDRMQTQRLLDAGWKVLRVWEHEIKAGLDEVVERVMFNYMDPSAHFSRRRVVVKVEECTEATCLERWHIEDLLDPACATTELRKRKSVRHSSLMGQNSANSSRES